MPLRGVHPETFVAAGLSDAIDATNAFPGAMASLKNLIPSATTPSQFMTRAAATQIGALGSSFFGGTVARVTAMIQVGDLVFGMVQSTSGTYNGKDIPFVFDPINNVQVGINNGIVMPTSITPTTQSNSFGWNPPFMCIFTNKKVIVAHSGFGGAGTGRYFGMFDISNYSNNTLTCTTVIGNPVLGTWSADPLAAGFRPGMKITGAGIPAGTMIESVTTTTVTISQNPTAAAAGVAMTVTGGTPTVPLYWAAQTLGQALTGVPLSVASLNGRAYYAVGNGVQFSDALDPTVITNASQALVLGDNAAVTCLQALPLASPVSGGVVQSLIAFKSAQAPWQITGDPATTNLSTNQIAGGIGTLAPRSVQPTPRGLAYIAPDGLRFIGPDGQCSEVVGANGKGVSKPFQQAYAPSRMAAACNVSLYRVTVRNSIAAGDLSEYWYHIDKNIWTGPHTCWSSTIIPYTSSNAGSLVNNPVGNGTGFIFHNEVAANGGLYLSLPYQDANSSFTEFGSSLTYQWQNSLIPDNHVSAANCVIEMTQSLVMANAVFTPTILNEAGTTLVTIANLPIAAAPMRQYQYQWNKPVVFKQMALRLTGNSALGIEIGNLYAKFKPLGYDLSSPYA